MTKGIENLQLADFEQHIGTDFHIHFEDSEQNQQTYTLKLIDAAGIGVKTRDINTHGRESFSLVFANDDTSQYIIQQIYHLNHDELGILPLFLVPLGTVEGAMRYEVVFT